MFRRQGQHQRAILSAQIERDATDAVVSPPSRPRGLRWRDRGRPPSGGAVVAGEECGWDVEPAAPSPDGGQPAGVGVEFHEDVFDVGGDGAHSDAEALGGAGVVPSGDQQTEHLELAAAQSVEVLPTARCPGRDCF